MDYSYFKTTLPPAVEPLHKTEVKAWMSQADTVDDALIESLIVAARIWCETVQGRAYVVRTCEVGYDDKFPPIFYLPLAPLVDVSSITYLAAATGTETTWSSDYYTVDTSSEPSRVYEGYGYYYPTPRAIRNTIKATYIVGYAAYISAESTTTNLLTVDGRTFTDGDIVRLYNSGGALPTGLSANTDYYVVDQDGYDFSLAATSGGSAISITAVDSGISFVEQADRIMPQTVKAAIMLVASHFYENREETTEVILKTIPLGAKHLLQQERLNW